MALKGNHSKIDAFRRKLIDKSTDDMQIPQPSGSFQIHDISLDPEAGVP